MTEKFTETTVINIKLLCQLKQSLNDSRTIIDQDIQNAIHFPNFYPYRWGAIFMLPWS